MLISFKQIDTHLNKDKVRKNNSMIINRKNHLNKSLNCKESFLTYQDDFFNIKMETNNINQSINELQLNNNISKIKLSKSKIYSTININDFLSYRNSEKKVTNFSISNKQHEEIFEERLDKNNSKNSLNSKNIELSNKENRFSLKKVNNFFNFDSINSSSTGQKQITNQERIPFRISKKFKIELKNINNINTNINNKNDTKISNNITNSNVISTNDRNINYINIINNDVNQPDSKSTLEKENFNQDEEKERVFTDCSICDYTCQTKKLLVSECFKHYLCESCAKNYYEEMIENGHKIFYCPFIKCKQNMDINKIEPLLSEKHKKLLEKNMNNNLDLPENNERVNTEINKMIMSKTEFISAYNQKNIINVGNIKDFYNYKKTKYLFCANCHEGALFSKTNTNFNKCLNCSFKECKFCLKEFTPSHMNPDNIDRCKVRYRQTARVYDSKKEIFLKFLLQMFLVVAMFYFVFVWLFIYLWNLFKKIFCLVKKKKNFINMFKYSIVFILTLAICIVFCPVIYIFLPYFPLIVAVSDF